MLTVNVPNIELEKNEIAVKTYSENVNWAEQVLKALPDHFIFTGKVVKTGFVTIPIYKFVCDR